MNHQKTLEQQIGTVDGAVLDISKATETTSPASREESILLDTDPDYIGPDLHDMMLTDVTSEKLHSEISALLETEYLSPAEENQSSPLFGWITGVNKRLFVNVVTRRCRRRHKGPNYPAFHVIFLCDTASPTTYICAEAMRVLLGPPSISSNDVALPPILMVQLADFSSVEAHLSPSTSHFADANVIGMDVLARLKTTIYGKDFSFELSTMDDASVM